MTNDDLQRIAWVRSLCETGGAAAVRKAAGVTLREIGGVVGASSSSVQRWELGLARPTGPRALAYAVTLERLATQGRRRVA